MKRLIILFVFILVTLNAQNTSITEKNRKERKNIIYGELGGNGLLYSLNYERVFYKKGIFQYSLRGGISAFPTFFNNNGNPLDWNILVPIENSFSFGRSKNKFSIGLAFTPYIMAYNIDADFRPCIQPSLLYRLESPKGFFLQAGVTGSFIFKSRADSPHVSPQPIPTPRISLGYRL